MSDIDDVWFIVHLNGYIGNAISALRMLQKERLVVSRLGNDIDAFEFRWVIDCDFFMWYIFIWWWLGFPDRAMELDRQITIMTEKAKQVISLNILWLIIQIFTT